MPQFALHVLQDGTQVVDLQADLLDDLQTRVVAPLVALRSDTRPIRNLHPIVEIDGAHHLVATHLIAAVPRRELGRPVGSLADHRDALIRAVDMVLSGL